MLRFAGSPSRSTGSLSRSTPSLPRIPGRRRIAPGQRAVEPVQRHEEPHCCRVSEVERRVSEVAVACNRRTVSTSWITVAYTKLLSHTQCPLSRFACSLAQITGEMERIRNPCRVSLVYSHDKPVPWRIDRLLPCYGASDCASMTTESDIELSREDIEGRMAADSARIATAETNPRGEDP